MGFKIALSFVYILATVWPSMASARYGNGAIKVSPPSFNQEELKFIVAYKSFTKALLHIQSSETKLKMICLGHERLTGIDLSSNMMRTQVQQYKASEECQRFLREDVPSMVMAYSDMRINLALHQSRSDEYISMTQSFGMMGQSVSKDIPCDQFASPLTFGSTNFCFNQIETIVDTTPRHILKKFSLKPLDTPLNAWFGQSGLPSVVNLPPLTWEEVLVATDIYHGYFTNNNHNMEFVLDELSVDHDQKVLDGLNSSQKRWASDIVNFHRNKRQSSATQANFFAAADYQARGAHVFSEYPENSAPRVYMEIISKYPVLAFYEPNTVNANLNCDSQDFAKQGVKALCEKYIQSLPRNFNSGVSFSLSRSKDIYPKLAMAYKKVLDLNRKLIESLDIKYNTEFLFNGQGILLDNIDPTYVSNWSDLLSMDVSLKNFLDMYPEYDRGQQNKFQRLKTTQELFTLGLMIGGAVGAGFACGVMGGWPLLLCLGVAGAGVNMAFYADTLHRHNNLMLKYFSTSTMETSGGLKLGLIEFESYKSEVQMLVMDTLMLGVGISAGRMSRLTRELVSNAKRQVVN